MPGPTNTEEAAILDARLDRSGLAVGLFKRDATVAITACSMSGATATFTTGSAHGLAANDHVTVAGVTPSGYNGEWKVQSVPTSTTFTATLNVSGLSAGSAFGTIAKWIEVSGGSYARVTITSTDWNAAVGGAPTVKTGPKVGVTWAFPTATADWGTVPGYGIWESATLRYVGVLTTPVTVLNGDNVQFDSSNQVTIQLGDPTDTF